MLPEPTAFIDSDGLTGINIADFDDGGTHEQSGRFQDRCRCYFAMVAVKIDVAAVNIQRGLPGNGWRGLDNGRR